MFQPRPEGMFMWVGYVQASDASAREQLEKVVELLVDGRCTSFEECIAWARRLFQVLLCHAFWIRTFVPETWGEKKGSTKTSVD